MVAAALAVVSPPERLSWEEIRRHYPEQWVRLADFEWLDLEQRQFRSAVVIGHGKSRHELCRATAHLIAGRDDVVCRFTGESPLPLDFLRFGL